AEVPSDAARYQYGIAPRAASVVEADTDAIEEYTVIVTVLGVTATFEQELIFGHCGNERLVLNPVFESHFRPRHERVVHPVAIDPANAGANEGTGIAGAEVIVVEHPCRSVEL